ncbi:DUF5680 domain-containing protein [Paenibacillus kobensis]|uniref:DUF5680 domain-containing protein n=1 Tax=Paenibacillus kobensis TaxID=59841 RepID=UPI000FD97EC7|nr:DUF5680 domain-containing protein [Paenibacillus kobensis]
MALDYEQLREFLVESKQHTYAAQGDEASVLPQLVGSKQLEYRRGEFFYRDIYFGMSFFAGQETVQQHDRPVWSMVYSGGITQPERSWEDTAAIYAFLRQALMQVDTVTVYRGPISYEQDRYLYRNEYEGSIDSFRGQEQIWLGGELVYELVYNGGTLR